MVFAPDNAVAEDVVVGTMTNCNNAYNPIVLNWKYSETDQIYTAEQLGLQAGDKINRISFRGYCRGNVTTNIQAWIENTVDVGYDDISMPDTQAMTDIYNGSYSFTVVGTNRSTVELLAFELSQPFVYTGNSIRIHVLSSSSSFAQAFFESQGNITNQALKRYNDTSIDAMRRARTYTGELPVLYLSVDRDSSAVVQGVVTNASTGEPIEGAQVRLVGTMIDDDNTAPVVNKADSVVYTTVTEADGSYTLDVAQSGFQYVASFSANGYKDHTVDVTIDSATVELNAALTPDGSSGVGDLTANGINAYGTVGGLVIETDAPAQVNVHNMAGTVVARVNAAAGATRVELPRGIYLVGRNKVVVK